MTTIAIANQKGGVGKTTVALNLAQGLAVRGYHTLAVDNDAQGNLTSGLLDDPAALAANVLSFYDDARQAVHPQRIQKHLELIGADIRLARIADRDFEVIFRLREGLDAFRQGRVPIFPVRLRAAPGVKWPYVSTGSTALPCNTSARARWPRHWRDTRICSALSSAG